MDGSSTIPSTSPPRLRSAAVSSCLVSSVVSFCSQLAHLSLSPARSRPLLEAFVAQLWGARTVTTRTDDPPHDAAPLRGPRPSTPSTAPLFVSTEECKASLCSQLSGLLRDEALKHYARRTGTASRDAYPPSGGCFCESEDCCRCSVSPCLPLPVLIQLLEVLKSLLASLSGSALFVQSALLSQTGEPPSTPRVSSSSSSSASSSTPSQHVGTGNPSTVSSPSVGERSSLSCSVASEACLSLRVLLGALSPEGSSPKRISKAEKKAKRAERQTQRRANQRGHKAPSKSSPSCSAEEQEGYRRALPSQAEEAISRRKERPQETECGVLEASEQDRRAAVRSAAEALATGLAVCSFPPCSTSAMLPAGNTPQSCGSSRCFLNQEAAGKSLFSASHVLRGSRWVIQEFLNALERCTSDAERGELGLQEAEERERNADSLTRTVLDQGTESVRTGVDRAREEPRGQDPKAKPEHTALELPAAAELLDCWLTALWQREARVRLCARVLGYAAGFTGRNQTFAQQTGNRTLRRYRSLTYTCGHSCVVSRLCLFFLKDVFLFVNASPGQHCRKELAPHRSAPVVYRHCARHAVTWPKASLLTAP